MGAIEGGCAPAILVCWCAPLARHGDVLVVFDNRR
jgi:hypothetical protein